MGYVFGLDDFLFRIVAPGGTDANNALTKWQRKNRERESSTPCFGLANAIPCLRRSRNNRRERSLESSRSAYPFVGYGFTNVAGSGDSRPFVLTGGPAGFATSEQGPRVRPFRGRLSVREESPC